MLCAHSFGRFAASFYAYFQALSTINLNYFWIWTCQVMCLCLVRGRWPKTPYIKVCVTEQHGPKKTFDYNKNDKSFGGMHHSWKYWDVATSAFFLLCIHDAAGGFALLKATAQQSRSGAQHQELQNKKRLEWKCWKCSLIAALSVIQRRCPWFWSRCCSCRSGLCFHSSCLILELFLWNYNLY